MSRPNSFQELIEETDVEESPGKMTSPELLENFKNTATLRGFSLSFHEAAESASPDSTSDGPASRIRPAWAAIRGREGSSGRGPDYGELAEQSIEAADALDERASDLEEALNDRLGDDDVRGYQ